MSISVMSESMRKNCLHSCSSRTLRLGMRQKMKRRFYRMLKWRKCRLSEISISTRKRSSKGAAIPQKVRVRINWSEMSRRSSQEICSKIGVRVTSLINLIYFRILSTDLNYPTRRRRWATCALGSSNMRRPSLTMRSPCTR